jgi:biotin transporter BioY
MYVRRTGGFLAGWVLGRYVGKRMAERRKRVGEWTTPRTRGFLMVAVFFIASLALSVRLPEQELWLMGGALFIGEGARRGYMAAYQRRHPDA